MSDEATEAAELVAGTAEAPDPGPPPGEPDPLFDNLLAGVKSAAGVPEEEPAKEEQADAKDEKKDEEDAEPEFDDLSDDRPWTPERIKNAAAVLRADRRKLSGMLRGLGAKESKIKESLRTLRTEKQQLNLITTRVMTDLETLRVGSAEEAMAALGRLSQRDPHAVYESLSLAMLGKAPQAKENAVIKALEAKIDQLNAKLERGEQQQTESQQVQQAQAAARACLQSPEEWPILAGKAAEAPEQIAQEFWQLYVQQSQAAGRWLDVETVADRVERTLRRKMPSHQAKQNGATGSGPADRVQETLAQANPGTAQSPPRSLSPSLAATSGGARREPTEEERAAEFARSAPPEFFQQFSF